MIISTSKINRDQQQLHEHIVKFHYKHFYNILQYMIEEDVLEGYVNRYNMNGDFWKEVDELDQHQYHYNKFYMELKVLAEEASTSLYWRPELKDMNDEPYYECERADEDIEL